jgi:hypothetical protein
MRFSETIKHVADDLVISRRHEAWMVENDHPVYSQRAIDLAQSQLGKVDRKRQGTLSASSLGECERYQQFVYIGMPKLAPDAKNAAKMQNGMFMHLRWQMEGLTEGWLRLAEVAVHSDAYHLIGTMDGINYDGSILELKSINANGFSRVSTFGPLIPHLYQMATYMLCSGREKGVFLYENKDTQEYTEIVVDPEDLPMTEALIKAEKMWESTQRQVLSEPLNDCMDKKGWKYASCPFRDRCLFVYDWAEAGR